MIPGELLTEPGEHLLNPGRPTLTVVVENSGDRPIQVGSHYHFFETNRALVYDREATRGMRLDIPAGTAVRFEPGESRTVRLVAARRRGAPGGMGDAPATPTSPLAGAREAP